MRIGKQRILPQTLRYCVYMAFPISCQRVSPTDPIERVGSDNSRHRRPAESRRRRPRSRPFPERRKVMRSSLRHQPGFSGAAVSSTEKDASSGWCNSKHRFSPVSELYPSQSQATIIPGSTIRGFLEAPETAACDQTVRHSRWEGRARAGNLREKIAEQTCSHSPLLVPETCWPLCHESGHSFLLIVRCK